MTHSLWRKLLLLIFPWGVKRIKRAEFCYKSRIYYNLDAAIEVLVVFGLGKRVPRIGASFCWCSVNKKEFGACT